MRKNLDITSYIFLLDPRKSLIATVNFDVMHWYYVVTFATKSHIYIKMTAHVDAEAWCYLDFCSVKRILWTSSS